ncbi:uncharacterized protein LOC114301940 isoform X2 [Camellia sinensis]|uniref:uncharacterized protein LOC114301940 isoform X2 n=1 Tax=Camellia sinensis TaxID=4442 RepID=UPI001035E60F|nr:uncharacterized protein LOC114301940 isoform X2 [Camellia sinensis]
MSQNRNRRSSQRFRSRFRSISAIQIGDSSERFRSSLSKSKSKSKFISTIQIGRDRAWTFQYVQKIHFRDDIRANVWFVWIVFNSSTKGGEKKAHCVGKAVGKKLDQECSFNPSKLHRNASAAANMNNLASQSSSANPVPLKCTSSSFDEKLLVQILYKVLFSISKTNPIVLYLRDIEKLLFRSQRIYNLFQKMLNKLSRPVSILGSRVVHGNDYGQVDKRLTALFPYNIEIREPEDETHLVSWKSQLEEDMKMIQYQDNKNHIIEVLAANDLDCDDLGSICAADTMVLGNYIEGIVVSAVSYHLMNNKDPEYGHGKLVISSSSLSHGLSTFQEGKSSGKDTLKLEAQTEPSMDAPKDEAVAVKPETKVGSTVPEASASTVKDAGNSAPASKALEIPPDNEFEKRTRPEVIPASEIGVTFKDIGALDDIEESLQELVMLPLRRPDLFKGGLLKPRRGILLFGRWEDNVGKGHCQRGWSKFHQRVYVYYHFKMVW